MASSAKSASQSESVGRGLFGRSRWNRSVYSRGPSLVRRSILLGYRVALGLDLFYKQQNPTSYVSYQTQTIGFGSRLGFALREDLGLQLRYSSTSRKSRWPLIDEL